MFQQLIKNLHGLQDNLEGMDAQIIAETIRTLHLTEVSLSKIRKSNSTWNQQQVEWRRNMLTKFQSSLEFKAMVHNASHEELEQFQLRFGIQFTTAGANQIPVLQEDISNASS